MKKFFIIFALLLVCTTDCYSAKNDDYFINFGGNKYKLLYSTKNTETGGYLNEYYKRGESYNIWTDMLAVHHFPNVYSPFTQIKAFQEYLDSVNCPSNLTFNDKKNSAIIDFIMINSDRLPVVLEFNVFKFIKSKKCGSIAIQYAKRYTATNAFQVEQIKKDFEKNRKKSINMLKNYSTQFVVEKEADLLLTEEVKELKDSNVLNVDENEITSEVVDSQKANEKIEEIAQESSEDANIQGAEDTTNISKDESVAEVETVVNSEQISLENIEKEHVGDNNITDELNITTEKIETIHVNEPVSAETEVLQVSVLPQNEAYNKQSDKKLENRAQENMIEDKKDNVKNEILEAVENIDIYVVDTEYITEDIGNIDEFYVIDEDLKFVEEFKPAVMKTKKEKPYQVINTKDEYISKPLSKREIRKQIKVAKKRLKKASKKLNQNL